MRNPLQEQLLKAGLVKKDKVAKVVRDQARQRQGKAPAEAQADKVDTAQLQAERAERDRALAAERNAQARAREVQAQVTQIVESTRLKREGDVAYRFADGGRLATVFVDRAMRDQLAAGSLVIVRHADGYEVLPRVAGDKVRERAPERIVLDHGSSKGTEPGGEDDDYYRQFVVPDDLMW
jgi:uncharacterized protein YaiL (DUF2058 family)